MQNKTKQNKKQPMDIIESNKRMKPLVCQVLGKPTYQQDSTETVFKVTRNYISNWKLYLI